MKATSFVILAILTVAALATPCPHSAKKLDAILSQKTGKSAALIAAGANDSTLEGVSRQSCRLQQVRLQQDIRREMQRNGRLIAGFLRATFHDCITATPNKATSGCNGSLRLRAELQNPNNARLGTVFDFLTPRLEGTCVSFADAIQIGVEAGTTYFRGPPLIRRLGRGRVDDDTADAVSEIPSAVASFAQLKALYARKGLTVRDLVSSIAAGHSIGRFVNPQNGQELRFTPDENRFDNSYAVNLLNIAENGEGLPGFNTIPSDVALTTDPEALELIEFYAGRINGRLSAGLGYSRLRRDFSSFLVKLSKLEGSNL